MLKGSKPALNSGNDGEIGTKNTSRESQAQKNIVRKPARWIYKPVLRLLQLPMIVILGIKITRDPSIRRIKGPIIMIGNHPSYLDPFLAALALPWLEINFVAASLFFRGRLKSILNLLGVIPKIQFRSDARALKGMLQVLHQGGVLGIFPEGQRSLDGCPQPMDDTLARLIKKVGCPVVAVRLSGAYLTWPRWTTGKFRPGRIDIDTSLLLNTEDIKALSAEQIAVKVRAGISFDDYNWQRSRKRKAGYLSRRPAEGLHNICHQCPACKQKMVMISDKSRLYCRVCSNEYKMDRHGFLHQPDSFRTDTGAMPVLETVHQWHLWQQKQLADEMSDSQFKIKIRVTVESARIDGGFSPDGQGEIEINPQGFYYKGVDSAGSTVYYERPKGRPKQFSADYGSNLEVPHDQGSWRFWPEQGQAVMLIADAMALLDNICSDT